MAKAVAQKENFKQKTMKKLNMKAEKTPKKEKLKNAFAKTTETILQKGPLKTSLKNTENNHKLRKAEKKKCPEDESQEKYMEVQTAVNGSNDNKGVIGSKGNQTLSKSAKRRLRRERKAALMESIVVKDFNASNNRENVGKLSRSQRKRLRRKKKREQMRQQDSDKLDTSPIPTKKPKIDLTEYAAGKGKVRKGCGTCGGEKPKCPQKPKCPPKPKVQPKPKEDPCNQKCVRKEKPKEESSDDDFDDEEEDDFDDSDDEQCKKKEDECPEEEDDDDDDEEEDDDDDDDDDENCDQPEAEEKCEEEEEEEEPKDELEEEEKCDEDEEEPKDLPEDEKVDENEEEDVDEEKCDEDEEKNDQKDEKGDDGECDDDVEGAGEVLTKSKSLKKKGHKDEKGNKVAGGKVHAKNFDLTIFMGNIDFKATEEDVRKFLEGILTPDEIEHIELGRTPQGKSRGFGFLRVKTREAFEKALRLNGVKLNSREVRMMKSEKRPDRRDSSNFRSNSANGIRSGSRGRGGYRGHSRGRGGGGRGGHNCLNKNSSRDRNLKKRPWGNDSNKGFEKTKKFKTEEKM